MTLDLAAVRIIANVRFPPIADIRASSMTMLNTAAKGQEARDSAEVLTDQEKTLSYIVGNSHLTYPHEPDRRDRDRPALEIENERLREALGEAILRLEAIEESADLAVRRLNALLEQP